MTPGLRSLRSLTRGYTLPPLRGSLTQISQMSLWVRKTECTGRRSLYLVDVPWEFAFLLVGIMIGLIIVLLRRFF